MTFAQQLDFWLTVGIAVSAGVLAAFVIERARPQ